MIRIESIRQEGTPSTGRMLFVDLYPESKDYVRPISECWELDIATGAPLHADFYDRATHEKWGEADERGHVVDDDHKLALDTAFRYFQEHGPTPAGFTPIVVAV